MRSRSIHKTISSRPVRLALILFILSCACGLLHGGSAFAADDEFTPLKRRLIDDGVSAAVVERAFSADITPLFKNVTNVFIIQESKLNYGQFLQPGPVAEARKFMARHAALFSRAEREYNVDPAVIASILMVETGFGKNTGKTPVLEVFSTFAIMTDKPHQDRIWTMLPYDAREHWGCYGFERRLDKKAAWAYDELKALLTWTHDRPEMLQTLKGSYMGACGWPQFLPSSVLKYGIDADDDGTVNLYGPTDTILSIANYLRSNGWRTNADRTEQEKVIFTYNKSTPYVKTILGAADLIRK